MLKKFLLLLIALSLMFAAIVVYTSYNIWYQNNFKTLIQTVVLKENDIKFLLFTDLAGFGDRSWSVYELPVKSIITKDIKKARDKVGVIFWNYSESGNNIENPKIEIVNNRYLVFSRGGYYHSLYDIKNKKVLVNDESPWGSFLLSEEYTLLDEDYTTEDMHFYMDKWVNRNLHAKIEQMIISR